jgi:hypothetical protein
LSGDGGRQCKTIPEGATDTISVSWSISWSVKPGWKFHDIGKKGAGDCKPDRFTGSSASGTCSVTAESGKWYDAKLIVIFEQA